MATSICSDCNLLLHARLRARLSLLASLRTRSQVRSKYSKRSDPPRLAYHWDTVPPTESQLESATAVIKTHPPRKLWTATEWRKQDQSDIDGPGTKLIPEVAFLGRSNVGKSSLLNALLQSPGLNRVGPRPGKTTTMHAWGLSASDPVTGGAGPGGEMETRLAVLDMPGYGFKSRDDWGKEIVTYLRRRKQLRRAFVLIDAMHGIKSADERMIDLLRETGISYQIIVSKADRLLDTGQGAAKARLQAFFELLRSQIVQPIGGIGVAGLGEILAVGCLGEEKKSAAIKESQMLGVEGVRWAVLVAAGLEQWATERWEKPSAKKRRRAEEELKLQAEGKTGAQLPIKDIPGTDSPGKDPFLESLMTSPIGTNAPSSLLSFLNLPDEEAAHAEHNAWFEFSDEAFSSSAAESSAHVAMPRSDAPLRTRSPTTSHSSKTTTANGAAFDPVGGLAELEAQIFNAKRPSRARSKNSSHNDLPPAPSSQSAKKSPEPEQETQSRATTLPPSGTGVGGMADLLAMVSPKARNSKSNNVKIGRRDDSLPLPPNTPSPLTSPARSLSATGVGVGGMADLLAMTGGDSSGSKSRKKGGRGKSGRRKGGRAMEAA
jgi:GTP-binding protein